MDDDEEVGNETEESERHFVIASEPVVVTDYSAHARRAIDTAERAADGASGGVLTSELLLLSMVELEACAAAQVMANCGFSKEAVSQSILFISGRTPSQAEAAPAVEYSPRVQRVLEAASHEAGNRQAKRIDTLHLLFALIRERQGIAVAALETPGAGLEMIGAALSNAMRSGMTDPS